MIKGKGTYAEDAAIRSEQGLAVHGQTTGVFPKRKPELYSRKPILIVSKYRDMAHNVPGMLHFKLGSAKSNETFRKPLAAYSNQASSGGSFVKK